MAEIVKINELRSKSLDRFTHGVKRGEHVGYKCLEDIYSVKQGTTLYLYGSPHCGKTELKYDLLINLSLQYGWKHAIYDPETGDPLDIIETIAEKYVQKDYHAGYGNQMTMKERVSAETWIEEHFYIIHAPDGITLLEFYEKCEEIEREFNISLHTTSIDPWDDVDHDYTEFNGSGRDDRYLEGALKHVRRIAKTHNWYNILVTHIRDQELVKDKATQQRYYPAPSPREIAKGQVWYRKGMAMVGLWRPKVGLNDINGIPYEWNEIHFIPSKQKPKGVAIPGEKPHHASLFYNPKTHRYYEKDPIGIDVELNAPF
jgi:hypothetical protein